MKEWISKYFTLVFAGYLTLCAIWFAFEPNGNACAGYTCAAMAWGLLWFIDHMHKKTIAGIERIYNESLDELKKHYIREVNLERAKNAT